VPSLGGTAFGWTSESRAALRLPIAKADPAAGAAPLLTIGAVTVDEVDMLELVVRSVVVVVVGAGSIVGVVGAMVALVSVVVVVVFVFTGFIEF
jgi:hypothetical protein